MKEFLSQLFEFLMRPRTLVAVVVLTGMILLFPDPWLTRLQLNGLTANYGWCVGVAFLVSALLLFFHIRGYPV